MSDGTVLVDMVLGTTNYKNELKKTETQSKESANKIEKSFLDAGKNIDNQLSTAVRSFASGMKSAALATAAALGIAGISSYLKEAAMAAARVETLGIVVRTVGENAGYSSGQMNAYVSQVKKMGITTQAAQDSVIKMAQAEMDLTKAAGFARIAQDAAVIGNTNSSDAFQRMIYGVKSGQVEILRTIGLNVNFEQSYQKTALTLKKSVATLTEAEKTQARMNTVMDYGARIAGTYEASMGTAGKQMSSMSRYTEEIQLKIGQLFGPALTAGVFATVDALKVLNTELDLLVKTEAWEEMQTYLGVGIAGAFEIIGGLAVGVWDVIRAILGPLGDFAKGVGTIAYGWGGIAAAIGPILSLLGDAIGMTWDLAKLLGNAATLTAALISFQPEVAKTAWKEMQSIYSDMEKRSEKMGKTFGDGITGAVGDYGIKVEKALNATKKLTAQEQKVQELISQGRAKDAAEATAILKKQEQDQKDNEINKRRFAQDAISRIKTENQEYMENEKIKFERSQMYAKEAGQSQIDTLTAVRDFSIKTANEKLAAEKKEIAAEMAAKALSGTTKEALGSERRTKELAAESKHRTALKNAELTLEKGKLEASKRTVDAKKSYLGELGIMNEAYVQAEMDSWDEQAREYKRVLGDRFDEERWRYEKGYALLTDITRKELAAEEKYYTAIGNSEKNLLQIKMAALEIEFDELEKNLTAKYGAEVAHDMAIRALGAAKSQTLDEERQRELNEQLSYYTQVQGYSTAQYDLEMEQIFLKSMKMAEKTGDMVLAQKYLADESQKAWVKMKEGSDSFFGGFGAGIIKMTEQTTTWGTAGSAAGQAFYSGVNDQLGDNLSSLFQGKIDDMNWDWDKVWKGMTDAFGKALSKMILEAALKPIVMKFNALWEAGAAAVLSAVGKLLGYAVDWFFSSSGGTDGGINAPPAGPGSVNVAYGGLIGGMNTGTDSYANDKVPAMLSPGEYVMPRSAVNPETVGALEYMRQTGQTPRGFADGGVVGQSNDYDWESINALVAAEAANLEAVAKETQWQLLLAQNQGSSAVYTYGMNSNPGTYDQMQPNTLDSIMAQIKANNYQPVTVLDRQLIATNENDLWRIYGTYYLDKIGNLQRAEAGTLHDDIGQDDGGFFGGILGTVLSVLTGGISDAVVAASGILSGSTTTDWMNVATGGFYSLLSGIAEGDILGGITESLFAAKDNPISNMANALGTSIGTVVQKVMNDVGLMPDDVYQKNYDYTEFIAQAVGSYFIGGAGKLAEGMSAADIIADVVSEVAVDAAKKYAIEVAKNVALKAIFPDEAGGSVSVSFSGMSGGEGLAESIKGFPSSTIPSEASFNVPLAARGGRMSGPFIGGERGAEWAVPTYEPERSNFLKEVGVDTTAIARELKALMGDAGGSTKIVIEVDGKVLGSIVADQTTSNSHLIKAIRRLAA